MGVIAEVALAGLSPKEVAVEICYGVLHGAHELDEISTQGMTCMGELGGERYRYEAVLRAERGGEHGYFVRVIPNPERFANRFATGLVTTS